jgi:hypothetical protein
MRRGAVRGLALLAGSIGYGFSMALMVRAGLGLGPLVQLFLLITPKRLLAVSGWSVAAHASELGAEAVARRAEARRNRFTTMGGCHSPEKKQPIPTC